MAFEDLGKQIKSKYPEYQDIPDFELGQKVLEKYPEYLDIVTKIPQDKTGRQQLQQKLKSPAELNLGLPPIGGMKTTTPFFPPQKIYKPGEVLRAEALPGAVERITAEPPKLPTTFGEKVEKVG